MATVDLGWTLEDGDGIERDPAEAVRWLESGARRGEPLALYALAELYKRGSGVRRDRDEAIRLHREAARAIDRTSRGIVTARLRALGAWQDEPSTAARAQR